MTTTTPAPHPPPALSRVGALVDQRLTDLQNRFFHPHRQDPTAVAAFARLRRGAGKAPGDLLDILEYTTVPWPVRTDEPSPQEWAVHVAMTLHAVHQQSGASRAHSRNGGDVGAALRRLHPGQSQDIPDPLLRRFRMLGTADSFGELVHHLRGAVQLLRAGGQALDHGLLADHLVRWRTDPSSVQLAWGRSFFRTRRDTPTPTADSPDSPKD